MATENRHMSPYRLLSKPRRRRIKPMGPLILAILPSLIARQINVLRQWRPATHPHIHLLRLAVAGQRLQPVDVVAIHDPWLVVEMRRDRRGNDGLGSGDLLYELQRITLRGSGLRPRSQPRPRGDWKA